MYELTGRRLVLAFVFSDAGEEEEVEEEPPGEDEFYRLVKETFDAREVTD